MITLHFRPILAIAAIAFAGFTAAFFATRSQGAASDQAAHAEPLTNTTTVPTERIEAHEKVEAHAAAIAESSMASPKPFADINERLKGCSEDDLVVTLRAISMTVPALDKTKYTRDELNELSEEIVRRGMRPGRGALAAFNTLLSLVESGIVDVNNLSALVESDEAEVRKRTLFWALSTSGEHATLTVRKALKSTRNLSADISEVVTLVGRDVVRANHSALPESELQTLVGSKQQ